MEVRPTMIVSQTSFAWLVLSITTSTACCMIRTLPELFSNLSSPRHFNWATVFFPSRSGIRHQFYVKIACVRRLLVGDGFAIWELLRTTVLIDWWIAWHARRVCCVVVKCCFRWGLFAGLCWSCSEVFESALTFSAESFWISVERFFSRVQFLQLWR